MAPEFEEFTIVDNIGLLLEQNIEDVRKDRKNNRWIYPSFPESNENLPQIVIEFDSPSYETESANEYLDEEYVGNIYKIYYYKRAQANINFHIISLRDYGYNVTYDGVTSYQKNQKLNSYIANSVNKFLLSHRNEIEEFCSRFEVVSKDIAFEDGESKWASTITAEVHYRELWTTEYIDGKLIKSYTLGVETK